MLRLRLAIFAALATLLAACTTTTTSTTHAPRLPVPAGGERVADDVVVVSGQFVMGEQPDGNSVLLAVPDGLLLVDTGRHPAHADAILAAATRAQRPIVAIVNSHWHLDHVGNNPRIRAAYPALKVSASGAIEGAMGDFLKGYRTQLNQAIAASHDANEQAKYRAEVAIIDQGKALYPDVRITAPGERTFGGRTLHVGLETDAVTGGDVWLLDRESRVLVAGDLVTLPAPFLDTACPKRWQAALARLDAQPFDRLVPGHGAVMDREDFTRYRTAFDHLLACANSPAPAAQCTAGWHRDADPLLASAADRKAADALLGYYLGQVLRGADAARRARKCPAP